MNRSEMVADFKRRLADRSYCAADIHAFLDGALLEISGRRAWSWLRRTHTWTLPAAVTVTDCAVVANSQVLTTTSTFPSLMMGRTVIIGDDSATVVGQNGNTILILDGPIPATFSGSVTVLYNNLSLPKGSTGVLASVELGDSASSVGLTAVGPSAILRRDHAIQGTPREYAAIKRQQFPQPQIAPPTPTTMGFGNSPGPRVGTGLSEPVFRYWYSYIDRETGWESALSPHTDIAIDDDYTWTFTLTRGTPSASSTVHVPAGFHVRIYRSKADGKVPHFMWAKSENLADNPGGSSFVVEDTIQDPFLGEPTSKTASSWFLQVWPAPSEATRIEAVYEAAPAALASDEDSPPFGAQFHGAVVDLAVAIALEAAAEQGRAEQKRAAAERVLARMELQDRPSRDLVRSVGSGGRRRSLSEMYPTPWTS